jgi:hypothetical protein
MPSVSPAFHSHCQDGQHGLSRPPAIVAIRQAVVGYVVAGAEADSDAQNACYNQNRVNSIAAASDCDASLNNKTLRERAAAPQDGSRL